MTARRLDPGAVTERAEVDQARAVLAELRSECEAAERALEALREARSAAPVSTPRRAEIHRALERPREPKGVLDGLDAETTQKLVYVAAAALVAFVVLLLVLML